MLSGLVSRVSFAVFCKEDGEMPVCEAFQIAYFTYLHAHVYNRHLFIYVYYYYFFSYYYIYVYMYRRYVRMYGEKLILIIYTFPQEGEQQT